jgi:alkanesulfonate monooxygenase SsuD/methylene tetrahydromethanopterin reductase-like flavin-dependent oxidoreductase (luciferase family)
MFLDLRNPQQWHRPWFDHYRQTLEWIEQAEQWGAGSVWMTEHHFFSDGYLPQPLTFAAAVAARTSRIRIGTAVLLGALRHPVHLAEEAALVDVLSGGRLELGLGAGWSQREYEVFGVDIGRRFSLTDQALARVRTLLNEDGVNPAPIQQPVPLWLGYQGPQGARRAGRLGAGLLALSAPLLEPYLRGLREGGHDPATARMGGLLDIIVADDPEQATERILPHLAHQANTYRRGKAEGTGKPAEDLTVEDLRRRVRAGEGLPGLTVLTADDAVREILARTAGLPARHIYFWASVAGMPDDLVERHLELLFRKVRPALARV